MDSKLQKCFHFRKRGARRRSGVKCTVGYSDMFGMKLKGRFRGLIRWVKNGKDVHISDDGYVSTKSDSGKDHYEHREIAEKILGRKLESREVVHHINGRAYDNRPENLCVMDGRDHDRYHNWYDWIKEKFGVYPRRETQLKKLRELNGILLLDLINKEAKKA